MKDSTQRFIVTFAQLSGGGVIFEAPGQVNKESVVMSTETSPATDRALIFRGFFTPRG